jgi:hypothetical protein
MNKIPLEKTLAGAYRFLFKNIGSIIGTLWLPLLVTIALCAGIVWLVVPHAWLMGHPPELPKLVQGSPDFEAVIAAYMVFCKPFLLGLPMFLFVSLVMGSMMFVGLMRHSLGQKTTTTFVYFSLGENVWRLAGALVLLYLIAILLYALLAGLFVAALFLIMPLMSKGAGILFLIVLGVSEFCFLVYFLFRLGFFIPAVVVAENRIGFGRSWQLGGGNFWRIFVIYLLIVIPVAFVVNIISQMTIMPVMMGEFIKIQHAPTAADMQAMFKMVASILPVIGAINVVQQIAIMGLTAGAIGTAYNAVTAEESTP